MQTYRVLCLRGSVSDYTISSSLPFLYIHFLSIHIHIHAHTYISVYIYMYNVTLSWSVITRGGACSAYNAFGVSDTCTTCSVCSTCSVCTAFGTHSHFTHRVIHTHTHTYPCSRTCMHQHFI